MTFAKTRAWLAIPAALLAIASVGGADLAQSQSPPARRIDSWSGLIVACKADAKLALTAEICGGAVAEAARQAGAGQVKFVALTESDGPDIKTAKAKAAGFDDAKAIEMSINIRASDSTTVVAALDVEALSRQHMMPSRPGQPTQYAKILTQSAVFSRDASTWQEAIAPSAKQLLGIFFKIYLAPPHSAKK
jgi:hypothetical protein